MAAKNDILRDKNGNQIFPATTAEQVSYDGKMNVKQAIKRGAVRNKVAPTVASMTDNEQIYVYTGTENGYTFGNWYYWDGTAWTSGGAYNAIEVNTDGTLTEEGAPADAKATGDKLSELKGDLNELKEQGIGGGSGVTSAFISALQELFGAVAVWDDSKISNPSAKISALSSFAGSGSDTPDVPSEPTETIPTSATLSSVGITLNGDATTATLSSTGIMVA